MKKYIGFGIAVCCLSLFVTELFFCSGCSQSTTTTTTLPTVNSTELNAAKAGVLVVSGGSSVGSSAGGVGSAAGARILSVGAFDAGPPASFFTNLLTGSASLDGYLPPTSESLGGNMTPYMRLVTVGGSPINGAFLASKKIASWETLTLQQIMSAGEGQQLAGMSAEVSSYVQRYVTAYITGGNVHPFNNSALFRGATTQADYMAWMFMYPSIESNVSQMASQTPGAPSHIYMVTPEPTANDKIGSMQMKMVFSKSATGEIVIGVSTDPNGKPVAGTYNGSSTLSTPAGSLESTLQMNFSAAGPPSWLKMVGTTETTPKYTVIVYMTPATMSATGEVLDSSGTKIGTLEGTSAGGKVYIGGSSEAFSF